MAQSLEEMHSFVGKFMQLCARGFHASLSLSNNDSSISVNLSADIGRVDQPRFAFNETKPRKNTSPTQLRRRKRRKEARSREENVAQVAAEQVVDESENFIDPSHSTGLDINSVDGLLSTSCESLVKECLKPEIVPLISSLPSQNFVPTYHSKTASPSTVLAQESFRIDRQLSSMSPYMSSSMDTSLSASSNISSGSKKINYPYGQNMRTNTYQR